MVIRTALLFAPTIGMAIAEGGKKWKDDPGLGDSYTDEQIVIYFIVKCCLW